MDPITAAIVVACSAGASAGLSETARQAVGDAYIGIKSLLVRKFGAQSQLLKAVEDVQAKPDSDARKAVLQEEVKSSKADQDAEVLQAARALLDNLKADPGGANVVQQATGSYIAQASGGSTASVNVNTPKG